MELVKIVVEFSDINSQGERDLGKSLGGVGEGCIEKTSLEYLARMKVKEEKGNCFEDDFYTF